MSPGCTPYGVHNYVSPSEYNLRAFFRDGVASFVTDPFSGWVASFVTDPFLRVGARGYVTEPFSGMGLRVL